MELKSSGIGNFIGGIFFAVVGIAATIVIYISASSDKSDASPLLSLIGVVFVIIGILMAVFAKNRIIHLDRSAESFIYTKKVIGGEALRQNFNISEIIAVNLYTYTSAATSGNSGDSAPNRRSKLSLVMKNNDLVEIEDSSSKGFQFNGMSVGSLITKAPLSKEANELSGFLGVPIQNQGQLSISDAVSSIKNAFNHGDGSVINENPPDSNPNTTNIKPDINQEPSSAPTQPQQMDETSSLPVTENNDIDTKNN